MQASDQATPGRIAISRDVKLQDIFQHPIPDTVGIVIDTPLTKDGAEKLAESIPTLATKIKNIKCFNFILLCLCSRDVAGIVLKALTPLKGVKNIAIRLNKHPGPASKSIREAVVAIRGTDAPFSVTRLPRELRYEILSYCLQPPGDDSSILISPDLPKQRNTCCKHCLPPSALKFGHCACSRQVGGYSTTCICRKYTFASFRVSRSLNADSTFVCFSRNRFILHGNPETLDFLRSLPDDALYAIRKLDILVKLREFHMYENKVPGNFQEIVDVISSKFNLSALHLTLDSGPEETGDHFTYKNRSWYYYDYIGAWLVTAVTNITEALLPLMPVKRFEVFLPNCSEIEKQLEKRAMGEDYDAYKFGKIMYSHRDVYDPHHYVTEEFDELPSEASSSS